MAAVHSAFAGMGSMEQRCFLRAGIEAELTAAGVPLPEGHDSIDCVRLQTAGPKTNCKGTTATMLSLVGLCGPAAPRQRGIIETALAEPRPCSVLGGAAPAARAGPARARHMAPIISSSEVD